VDTEQRPDDNAEVMSIDFIDEPTSDTIGGVFNPKNKQSKPNIDSALKQRLASEFSVIMD
jgi:hypothetical protein